MNRFFIALLSVIYLLCANPTFAKSKKNDIGQNKNFVASFGSWKLFVIKEKQKLQEILKQCYIANVPRTKISNIKGREQPYLAVTYFPQERRNEVLVVSGYDLASGIAVEFSVDNGRFDMRSDGELAWLNQNLDDAVVGRMQNGSLVVVRAFNDKHEYSTDQYYLDGFSEAYDAMLLRCRKIEDGQIQ